MKRKMMVMMPRMPKVVMGRSHRRENLKMRMGIRKKMGARERVKVSHMAMTVYDMTLSYILDYHAFLMLPFTEFLTCLNFEIRNCTLLTRSYSMFRTLPQDEF